MAGCGQILLLEDQSNTDRLYPLLLALDKYQVTSAKTLAVAADLCSATTFDLLICDPCLPDGDAYSLLKSARHGCPGIRAILVVRAALSWGTEAAIASGFSVCLLKPVTCERLRCVIERVLSGPEEPLLAFSG
jgi:DNA-binding NtrC family response regulator